MADKPLLHELLREDQEPFHLKSYIANRRSQLNNSTTTLQLRKRRPIINETHTNLCKHACFFSFHTSPADVTRSPFLDLPSPAKSPCKSPNAAAFLHIPSRTATLLVEAAMRIQKQQQSKPKPHARNGFGLFGSFLKRLKDRSKNRKLAIEDNDIVRVAQEINEAEENIRMSCSCSNPRLSSADWTEEINEDKSLDFQASTSSRVSELSEELAREFCSSPFRFSLHKSPSSAGRRTPEFSSPAHSPTRRVKQEKENYELRNSGNTQGEEEEEKEQCSPVSVLDPPFDEDDDEREGGDAEEDEFDMECSYENVQRAKQQLLYRLRRFEKLAELDPVELERKLLEGSDDEGHMEREGSEGDEALSPYRQSNVETFVSQVLNQSSLKYHSRCMSADMKRLVSDLIVEEKRQMIHPGANEVVMGRICNKLDSWREVESDTIDMMIGLDFNKELGVWTKCGQEIEDTAAEIELAIYVLLLQEITEDLLSTKQMDMVSCSSF